MVKSKVVVMVYVYDMLRHKVTAIRDDNIFTRLQHIFDIFFPVSVVLAWSTHIKNGLSFYKLWEGQLLDMSPFSLKISAKLLFS